MKYLWRALQGGFMEEWVLGVILTTLAFGLIALAIRLEKCHAGILIMAENLKEAFKQDVENASVKTSDNFIDSIREELLDTVNSVIGNMAPPTIMDHLGGVISQFAQMKLMKAMKEEGMMGAIAEQIPALNQEGDED